MNNQISAEVLAYSVNQQGDELLSVKATLPRMILAELNTHRMFSRNSASSRAIPFNRMVEMVQDNPFIPIAWQKDHKGMQGTEYFRNNKTYKWVDYHIGNWLKARDSAVEQARCLSEDGVTKQLCNRLLEPFMWHTVIITASEWENFFKLRCPEYVSSSTGETYRSRKDYSRDIEKNFEEGAVHSMKDLDWLRINKSQAEIHIQALAEAIWDAKNESTPKELAPGEWHIPYGDNLDYDKLCFAADYQLGDNFDVINLAIESAKLKIATARCARLSYQTLGANPVIDYDKDIGLYNKLLGPPFHASPFEHCGKAMTDEEYYSNIRGKMSSISNEDIQREFGTTMHHLPVAGALPNEAVGWSRNFKGFMQYRQLVEEYV